MTLKENIEWLAEGRFESGAKNIKNSLENDKTLEKYGLEYNGGEPVYSKNKSTVVSFGIRENSKIWNLLRKYGIAFVSATRASHSYFLEYNLRNNTFEVLCLYWDSNQSYADNNPKQKITKLPTEFNEESLIKEVLPFMIKNKKINSDMKSQLNHDEYNSANKYTKSHFNY